MECRDVCLGLRLLFVVLAVQEAVPGHRMIGARMVGTFRGTDMQGNVGRRGYIGVALDTNANVFASQGRTQRAPTLVILARAPLSGPIHSCLDEVG